MATVKDFKITKNVNSNKILKDIENVLNELGINGENMNLISRTLQRKILL